VISSDRSVSPDFPTPEGRRNAGALVTKREIATTATSLAQGIAAVASATDSFAEHIHDTMEAGAWLSMKRLCAWLSKRARPPLPN